MRLLSQQPFIAFLLGAMPSPGGLRNGRLDFGPQGILRLVGVAGMYPSSCNSESSFDDAGIRRTSRRTRLENKEKNTVDLLTPVFLFLAFAKGLPQRGQDLPGTVPALGPQKPRPGAMPPFNFSFSSQG